MSNRTYWIIEEISWGAIDIMKLGNPQPHPQPTPNPHPPPGTHQNSNTNIALKVQKHQKQQDYTKQTKLHHAPKLAKIILFFRYVGFSKGHKSPIKADIEKMKNMSPGIAL